MDNQIKQWDEAADAIIQQESATATKSMVKTDKLRDEIVNEAFAAALEPPAVSELGAFWQQWFQDVGAHATMDVIHAIAEREIAVRDHLEPIRKAIETCEANMGTLSADYLVRKSDWDALAALVKESK